MTTDAPQPQITPSENGPYLVPGSLPVRKADGMPARDVAEKVRLCRCGGSANASSTVALPRCVPTR